MTSLTPTARHIEPTSNVAEKPKTQRAGWTHFLVADLIAVFTADGLDEARVQMRERHGIAPERTDAKLADLKLLALDPDEIAKVEGFLTFLLGLDASSRALALSKLRAAMKGAK